MAHGQAELLGVPKSWVLDQARRDAIPYGAPSDM
jgi:hypothetical protein